MNRKILFAGLVVLFCSFLSGVNAFAGGLGIGVEGGYSLGKEFNSGLISVEYRNPDFLNFGIDVHLYNYTPNDLTTRSYLGFVYTGSKLLGRKSLTIDWLAGISSAQTKYTTYKTDWSTTPGLGLEGNYEITSKWRVGTKAVGIIYSDGYSLLYQAGPEFKYKKLKATLGIDGIMSVSTGEGQSGTPSNDLGALVSVGYSF